LPSLRSFRWTFALVCLTVFGTVASAQTGCVTTITGKVYSPAGPTNGDPIPNILVFAYPTTLPKFALNTGPVSCSAQSSLVPQTGIIGAGTSDAAGNYTFAATNMPASVNIVIQAGKWRQQYPATAITQCATNTLAPLTMPAAQSATADLPHIAVVTGSVDGAECIFNQIGISPSEVTSPAGTGSINLYKGAYSGGEVNPDNATNPTPGESTLVTSLPTMDQYDVVMFACQGGSAQALATAGNQANILSYTNIGGRVFTTHWEYIWLVDSFPTVANFTGSGGTPSSTIATINTTTFTEGKILADWIQNVGAEYNNQYGQIQLNNLDINTTAVNVPPSQNWATVNTSAATSMQFTFDTPIGQNGVPTVAITYANTQTSFSPGDTGDSVIITVTNNSTTPTLPGLTLNMTPPTGLVNTILSDNNGSGWACNGSLQCTYPGSLAVNASITAKFTFDIASTSPLGDATIGAALSGGGLSGTGQCGRVLYNDYHVENQALNKNSTYLYPSQCSGSSGTLTAQEKFLEFSLYNLSNFVSTTTNDIIDIQALPTLAWTSPLPTIPYGTVNYTSTLPTASYASAAVAGGWTYAPALSTVLPVGANQKVCATFVPTLTVDYLTPTTPVCSTITVVPDTTTTTIASIPSPIFYGQTFTVSTPVVTTAGPATLTQGTVTFTITPQGGTAQQFCTLTPGVGTCTLPTLYDAGTYTLQACYHDPAGDFADSCSAPYTVVINPDPTTSTVASSNDPATVGTSVTLTATIGDPYATATGNVQFMDGSTPLGPLQPLTSGTTVSYTTSAFIIGSHNITACYSPVIDPSGTYDFLPICSANFIQSVVLVPSSPLGTVTLLNSSANPSIVGQTVTFTAAVATTGTFISTPTGTINFFDGTTALNTTPVALNPSGAATFTTSTLTAGTHPITALYSGSTTYATSTSQVLSQVVTSALTPAGTGFLMQVNPTAISVGVGSTATVAVSIAALNNFNQAVQLTCTGAPYETTCTFAQSLIPSGGGKTTLSITPASPSACGSGAGDFTATGGFGGSLPLVALSAGIALVFFRKRKRVVQGLTLVLALCLLPVLNGCSTRCTDLGTQPNTYVLTVTGTAVPGGSNVVQTSTQTIVMNVHL
jgi:hypothetical protein